MPVTVTFDLSASTDGNDRTRIRLAFQRFGWETIGGTAYRYPPLDVQPGTPPSSEDWFNHVIPALMYMRSLIESKKILISNFTIDAFSSTGWRQGIGPHIQDSQSLSMTDVTGADAAVLSEPRLKNWLADCSQATVS